MSKGSLLDTKTVNLNEIFGSGKIYKVPQFQRDYSWNKDNWEDLWNDIEIAKNNMSPHYMGSVVLQSNNSKEFLIIDGQQRFTTLSILILSVINSIQNLIDRGIEPEANKERIELLMSQYIGHKDASSLTYSSKLFLNENNNGFFQNRLIRFKDPINIKKLSSSENLLWEAYLFFSDKLEGLFEEEGWQYASFLNNIVGELMMFIQIIVEDELNAYTVFETLNSRGVELTSTDLLKNYLFSLVAVSDTDLKQVKDQWKKVIDVIGLKEFPNFLRYYLLATRKQITKEYLFKEIKSYVKNGHDVFNLLDNLENFAYIYISLGNYDDEIWSEDKELKTYISLLKTFRVIQWRPLAMIAYEKLDPIEFKKFIKSLVALTYRYNVIAKLQTNEMEKVFSKAAIKLYNGKIKTVKEISLEIKTLYVEDEEFKSYFSVKQFNTKNSTDKKLLRYTLYKIEAQISNGNEYDFEVDSGTIEHILPESFSESWQNSFSEDEYYRNIYLIGNMTLLEASKNNKEAADKDFDTKKEVYNSSKFEMTKKIDFNEWSPKSIKHRQSYLAKIASSVWRINF